MEQQQQRTSASPTWYRNTAIIFFVIAGVLVWAGIKRHDWIYWAFAAITLLNAIMTTLKFIAVKETGR
jgi:hypothetical protein